MISIVELEKMTADVRISSVSYDVAQEEAQIKFIMSVKYGDHRPVEKIFGQVVKLSEPKEIETFLEDKKKFLNEILEEEKEKLRLLHKISPSVEVDLRQIADKLFERMNTLCSKSRGSSIIEKSILQSLASS
ncbi:MAG: hypothetical protein QW231_03020 [Candidatus Bathyarchaeia archaeon]